MNLQRFLHLKEQAEEHRRKADEAKGALEQLMTQLREEFGAASVEEAKELLRKLGKESASAERSYNDALQRFEQDHGDKLG